MMKRTSLAVLPIVLLFATTALAAESYEIHLDRPTKVGDRHDLRASGVEKRHTVVTVSGRKVNEESTALAGTLDARVTVLAVTRGSPSKVRINVRSMTVRKDGKDVPAPAAGTVITGSRDDRGQDMFEIEGGDLSEPAHDVLKLLVTLTDGNGVSDGDIIDAKGAKHIGDSWPINAEAAAEEASEGEFKVDPKSVKGQTLLLAEDSVHGERCALLRSTMTGKLAKGKLPNGAQIRSAQLDGTLMIWVPIDRATPIPKGIMSFEMSMEMVIEQPGRPQVDVSVVGRGAATRTITPVN